VELEAELGGLQEVSRWHASCVKISVLPKRKPRSKRHEVVQPDDPSYRLIPLTQGYNTVVDTEDYERVNQWNWSAFKSRGRVYAYRKTFQRSIFMHRFIFDAKESEDVDHHDNDGLNNRKYNLRSCVQSQNGMNRGKPVSNKSGYKGVSWAKHANKWTAHIQANKKQENLGLFTDPVEAAKAYDQRARELHGEFAVLNFPHQPPPYPGLV
jgi:AP2 domain